MNGDENVVMNKHVKQPSVVGPLRVPNKTGPQRPALGEVTATAVNKQVCLFFLWSFRHRSMTVGIVVPSFVHVQLWLMVRILLATETIWEVC